MSASSSATRRPVHAGLIRLVGHKLPAWLRVSLVATLYLAMIAVNVASTSNAGIFKDKGPKYFADKYFTPITPNGWTFSIWGLIFTGEALYAIFQLLPSQRNRAYHKDIAGWVMCAFVLQSLWLLCWPLDAFWCSEVVIGASLVSLHYVCALLAESNDRSEFSWKEEFLVRLGFSLNLSWSLIANLANLTIVLKHEGYDMSADWAVAWLIIAVLIGAYVAFTRFDAAYVFALCWALAGVASKQKDFFPIVASWATGSIVFVVIAFASALLLRRAGVIPVSDVEFEQLAQDADLALNSASLHEPLAI